MHAIKRMNQRISEHLTVLTNWVENYPNDHDRAEQIKGEIMNRIRETQRIAWKCGNDYRPQRVA